MATISLLLRNRSKAAKHISDFTLVLKDFLINNSGLNKDALFRFKNSELVIMQAPESWLKCRENSCFILYQPHKETYTVNGSAEEEVCFLVKYSALVRFLDPIRKSLASLRMVFTDKDTEVQATLFGGSRLNFSVQCDVIPSPPKLEIDFRKLTLVAELSPAISKVLCAKNRLYHMVLLPESIQFQQFTGSRLTRSEKVKPAQLASYHYERLMAQLDEKPMILLNSSYLTKHLQFCQRIGNPPVDIYVKADGNDQIIIKVETQKMVIIKNFGCRLADILGKVPVEKVQFRRNLKRAEGQADIQIQSSEVHPSIQQTAAKVKQQHIQTRQPEVATMQIENSMVVESTNLVIVKDNQEMEPMPYHLMLLKVRKAEEEAREQAIQQQKPIEVEESSESQAQPVDQQWQKYKKEEDETQRQRYHKQF